MGNKLTVGCAQIEVKVREKTSKSEISRMTEKVKEYLAEAKKNRINIVCFAECTLTGYFPEIESFRKLPKRYLDEKVQEIQNTCEQLKIYCVVGLTYPHKLKPYNRAVVISDKGKIVAKYDKIQLFPGEEKYYAAGDNLIFFEINGIRCSVIICHDMDRYPELLRILRNRGAKIIFHPAYTSASDDYHSDWFTGVLEALYVARAAENGVFVATVNGAVYPQGGASRQEAHSMIIDPEGKIITRASRGREELVIAAIDIELTANAGWKGRYNRRTDLYKIVDISSGKTF